MLRSRPLRSSCNSRTPCRQAAPPRTNCREPLTLPDAENSKELAARLAAQGVDEFVTVDVVPLLTAEHFRVRAFVKVTAKGVRTGREYGVVYSLGARGVPRDVRPGARRARRGAANLDHEHRGDGIAGRRHCVPRRELRETLGQRVRARADARLKRLQSSRYAATIRIRP
jgi:hypothetical protein